MPLRKKFSHRALGLLRHVHASLAHPLQQVVGRHVDEFDLVGLIEQSIGQGLELTNPGDLSHHVAQRLEMLNVDRGVHVDAGIEHLFDVLPALLVPRRRIAAGDVGMRELIDQQQVRLARECRVQIEFAARDLTEVDQ